LEQKYDDQIVGDKEAPTNWPAVPEGGGGAGMSGGRLSPKTRKMRPRRIRAMTADYVSLVVHSVY
jgi:hypothetical protein